MSSVQTVRASTPLLPMSAPKFGCRFFTYMTPKPYAGQDRFLRGCLLDGRNSLRDQAARAVPEVDREHHKNWENLIMTSGQPDAWGMAAYSPVTPAPSIYRRATMASDDPVFNMVARSLGLAKQPSSPFRWLRKHVARFTPSRQPVPVPGAAPGYPVETLLAHVRVGPNRILENAHPFRHGEWSFIHNGFVPDPVIQRLESDIENKYQAVLGAKPQGTTDTERVFYYLLGRMQAEHGRKSNQHQKANQQICEIFDRNGIRVDEITGERQPQHLQPHRQPDPRPGQEQPDQREGQAVGGAHPPCHCRACPGNP